MREHDLVTKPALHILPRPEDIYRAAAESFVRVARQSMEAHGRFTVALGGGSTPRALYTLLATDPELRLALPLAHTHFFWGDERHVPPDHADSNYRMAHDAMLESLGVEADQIHRIAGEYPDAALAAREYEAALRKFFALEPGEFPRFDLVLLGLGPDGHTASLFPCSQALYENVRSVVANRVVKLAADRITLTAPAINHAAHVVFLVCGADKASALHAVLEGPRKQRQLPAQLIAPREGTLTWFADAAAARMLKKRAPTTASPNSQA